MSCKEAVPLGWKEYLVAAAMGERERLVALRPPLRRVEAAEMNPRSVSVCDFMRRLLAFGHAHMNGDAI